MAWMFGHETKCPYCFEVIQEESIVYRCSNRGCAPLEDVKLANFAAMIGATDVETMLQPIVSRPPSGYEAGTQVRQGAAAADLCTLPPVDRDRALSGLSHGSPERLDAGPRADHRDGRQRRQWQERS